MTIYDIIEQIASTSSLNEKKAILQKNKDNEILRLSFFYMGNPRFNYYIRVEPYDAGSMAGKLVGRDLDITDFMLLDALNAREITGNAAREAVARQTEEMNSGAKTIFHRIINRDLRCNAGRSLANATWNNMIPEFAVMLCSKMDAKMEDKLRKLEGKKKFDVSTKEDGGRLITIVDAEGQVAYHSRNGSTLELYGAFDGLSKTPGYVYDGELLALHADGTIAPRKVGNGLYTKAVRGTLSKEEAKFLVYICWDMIPIDVYMGNGKSAGYSDRIAMLEGTKLPKNVRTIEHKLVSTVDECREFYLEMRAQGKEGAIIKIADSEWEDGRSKQQIKLKAEETADLMCVGYEPGTGKYAGMIGSLIMESSCGQLRVNVGTGFKDADRMKNPSEYIGRVIEVNYNEKITSRGKDTHSLFLPVFNQVRFDKDVANSLEELP